MLPDIMNFKTILIAVLLAVPAFAQSDVTLYADAGQRGAAQSLRAGKNAVNAALTGRVSSLTVPDGFYAEVCGDTANPRVIGPPRETCFTFPEGRYNFHALNDRVSKVIVSHPTVEHPVSDREHLVTIFTGRGHTGNSFSFGDRPGGAWRYLLNQVVTGTPDGNPAPLWKNTASSIWVADGWYVIVNLRYEQQSEITDHTMRIDAGYHDLPAAYDNKIQVVMVGRVR